jgi:hypothetical protein
MHEGINIDIIPHIGHIGPEKFQFTITTFPALWHNQKREPKHYLQQNNLLTHQQFQVPHCWLIRVACARVYIYIFQIVNVTNQTVYTLLRFHLHLSIIREFKICVYYRSASASAIRRAGLRNPSPSRSCTGRGRIRFLGSVLTRLLVIFWPRGPFWFRPAPSISISDQYTSSDLTI